MHFTAPEGREAEATTLDGQLHTADTAAALVAPSLPEDEIADILGTSRELVPMADVNAARAVLVRNLLAARRAAARKEKQR